MSRSLLLASNIDTKFWPYAVNTSIWLKNRMYHSSTKQIPLVLAKNQHPNPNEFKRFGAVCFKFTELEERKSRFKPVAKPGIFLGYDLKSSFATGLIYDPDTQRVSRRHLSDLSFLEKYTWQEYAKSKVKPYSVPVIPDPKASSLLNKHNKLFAEISDIEDDFDDDDE